MWRSRFLFFLILMVPPMALGEASCSGQPAVARPPFDSRFRTDDLTPRERRDWHRMTEQLAAPCADLSLSIDRCVRENRGCRACVPAAEFLLKAIRDGRARDQIEATFRFRFAPDQVKPIDVLGAPSIGAAGAPVTIVEFADFQCPFCATSVAVLDGIVNGFKPHVRLVFKHYPLGAHRYAEAAARAAVAAANQGKFWELHHKLLQNQHALSPTDLENYASEIGLDLARFKAEMASAETIARIKSDEAQGTRLGVTGTPSIFVNGRFFNLKYFDMAGGELAEWVQLEIEMTTGKRVDSLKPVPSAQPAEERGH